MTGAPERARAGPPESTSGLRRGLLLPVATGIGLLLVVIVGGVYWTERQVLLRSLAQRAESVETLMAEELEGDGELMLAILDMLARDPRVAEAFRARDRPGLHALTGRLFERLHERYGISHLYFSDADRVCFLRVHRPDFHGDRIDRFTTREAARTAAPSHGLESGRFRGLFTHRAVMPWYRDGELLGYLELGKEIADLTSDIHERLGLDVVVLLHKSQVERRFWEDGMRFLGRDPRWTLLPGMVVVDQTLEVGPSDLRELVEESLADPDPGAFALRLETQRYLASLLPIHNARGDIVGELVLLMRTTKRYGEAQQRALLVTLLCLGLGLGFTALLGRIEIHMKRQHEERGQLEAELRLAQKLEALGRLAGGIAHDFNNALTGITGFVQLAADQLPPRFPARRDLESALQAAEQSAHLARQLLIFSRQKTSERRPARLEVVVEHTVELLRPLIGEQIELRVEARSATPLVRVDEGQLNQVLTNLVVNARDAMTDGGTLTITTSATVVDPGRNGQLAGLPRGRYAVLVVADTGCGMDESTRQRIFEPFFTTKDAGEGTGLGLAMTYGIVEQHQGRITVESAPGAGTRFRIYLPEAEPGAEESLDRPEPAAPAERFRPATVLVVEDQKTVRAVVERMLAGLGYEVLTACDPEEATDLFGRANGRISLLLTDIVMPGCDGKTLYRNLAARRPDLKVVYMSGYTEGKLSRDYDLHEDEIFIAKPFNRDALARTVAEALRN